MRGTLSLDGRGSEAAALLSLLTDFRSGLIRGLLARTAAKQHPEQQSQDSSDETADCWTYDQAPQFWRFVVSTISHALLPLLVLSGG